MKKLKFNNIRLNKKEFHKSIEPIDFQKSKEPIKFHSEPSNDKTYLQAKAKDFDAKIKTNFLGNGVPKKIYIILVLLALLLILL